MPLATRKTLFAATVAAAAALVSGATACQDVSGIDDGAEGSLTTADLASLPEDGIFASVIGLAVSTLPGIGSYETPIQFRGIQHSVTVIYGAAAAFHPVALDAWGREAVSEDRRRCAGSDAGLLAKHRRVALAYSAAWGVREQFPELAGPLDGLLSSWGLDPQRCPGGHGCSDTSTPWGLAHALAHDSADFASRDGWNADGSLSSARNRVPFSDWRRRPYHPVNSPWLLRRKRRWQPLLESDGRGFQYHQLHVTSHIGETARSFYLTDEQICGLKAPRPHYRLRREALDALARTAQLNDTTKSEVEFFDSKLTSVVPLQVQFYARTGVSLDSFEFIAADAAVISALYESVIVVWKEKVRHDLVRPTSTVHDLFEGQDVESYGGPDAGATVTLKGDEWQPYIRVMPHAEYPSGSSCVCKAFQRVMLALTGTDDVTAALGGAPLVQEVSAGSSGIESGTPATAQVFTYATWSDISDRCGQSRLNGGMHFAASVPAGEDLCAPVGDIAAAAFQSLAAGQRPDHVVDFDAPTDMSGTRDCH